MSYFLRNEENERKQMRKRLRMWGVELEREGGNWERDENMDECIVDEIKGNVTERERENIQIQINRAREREWASEIRKKRETKNKCEKKRDRGRENKVGKEKRWVER